jgi:hypothetical protein
MEGWTTIMYLVSIHFLTDKIKMIDSGSPAVAIIYFNLLIFIGSYFLMNIVVAVIITTRPRRLTMRTLSTSPQRAQSLMKATS